jgi:hypothetical protein
MQLQFEVSVVEERLEWLSDSKVVEDERGVTFE